MGMCAIQGPRVLHEEEDGEISPRSTTSSSSVSSCGYGSATSQELDIIEASDHFYQDSAIWQRTIPKGRRCKPLSFSGMILYDENGNQIELSLQDADDDEDDEYFSPQRNLVEREAEFRFPSME